MMQAMPDLVPLIKCALAISLFKCVIHRYIVDMLDFVFVVCAI